MWPRSPPPPAPWSTRTGPRPVPRPGRQRPRSDAGPYVPAPAAPWNAHPHRRYPPDTGDVLRHGAARIAAAFARIGDPAASTVARDSLHPLMHPTERVDCGVVLAGECVLVLDRGDVALRPGRADEAAAAVLWLASPAGGFIIGQTIVADGGTPISDGH